MLNKEYLRDYSFDDTDIAKDKGIEDMSFIEEDVIAENFNAFLIILDQFRNTYSYSHMAFALICMKKDI